MKDGSWIHRRLLEIMDSEGITQMDITNAENMLITKFRLHKEDVRNALREMAANGMIREMTQRKIKF